MSEFDKVIGYESIKEELLQIIDMINNKEVFEKLGARFPHGVLITGNPGLGKTLLANCFIKESGLNSYTLRKTKGDNDFMNHITETFDKALENAPSVILLDDLDKFSNEDDEYRDAEEYVVVQAAIDKVKDKGVIVLATVNNVCKLPDSLIRSGRFDRKISVETPTLEDALKIITYYLKDKSVSKELNMEDINRMVSFGSCSDLESVLNEAAIYAGTKRKECIEMEDIVRAVLRLEYNSLDNDHKVDQDVLERTACHEAGHLVIAEVIKDGSVGLASIRSCGRDNVGGFIHRCIEFDRRPHSVLVSLGGKAATELNYGRCASGCYSDLKKAGEQVRDGISNSGTMGMGLVDVSTRQFPNNPESFTARNEAVTIAELERLMFIARDIILKNKDFFEKVWKALLEKETLLYSDIQKIKKTCTIVPVEIN